MQIKSIKWPIKAIVNETKYFYALTLHLLKRKKVFDKPLIRYLGNGSISPNYGRPVCFFCNYDKENVVGDYVYHYLNTLVLAGFDIVFISSSDTISDTDIKKLSDYCIRILNRENRGYDFFGWRTGLEEYPLYHAHSGLLLANDSVLGPLFSISGIIKKLENCDADIIGMTDCFQFYPHLQSYFLYCKKAVILSEAFTQFFRQVEVIESKIVVVRKYEIGFSRFFGRRFRLLALYSLESVLPQVNYYRRPFKWIEPTTHLWNLLITKCQFPFLKKSILTRRGVSTKEISTVLAESGSLYDVHKLAGSISKPSLAK